MQRADSKETAPIHSLSVPSVVNFSVAAKQVSACFLPLRSFSCVSFLLSSLFKPTKRLLESSTSFLQPSSLWLRHRNQIYFLFSQLVHLLCQRGISFSFIHSAVHSLHQNVFSHWPWLRAMMYFGCLLLRINWMEQITLFGLI